MGPKNTQMKDQGASDVKEHSSHDEVGKGCNDEQQSEDEDYGDDEVGKGRNDEQQSEDEDYGDDEDYAPVEDDLLGSDAELSAVGDDEDKLLESGRAQEGEVDIDENTSSGSSNGDYGMDGAHLVSDMREPEEKTGEEVALDAEVDVEGDTEKHAGQEGSGVQETTAASGNTEPPTVDRDNEPRTGQADFSLISSRKLESFPSAFGRSVVNKAPVVMMNMPIHPPGTNIEMQQVMRSRLPSTTSTVSEGEVPTSVERMMDARMGVLHTSGSSVNSPPPSQEQQQEVCQPLVGQEVVSAVPQ